MTYSSFDIDSAAGCSGGPKRAISTRHVAVLSLSTLALGLLIGILSGHYGISSDSDPTDTGNAGTSDEIVGGNPTTTLILTTAAGSNPTTTLILTTAAGSNPTTTLILTTAAGSNPTTTLILTTAAGSNPTTTLILTTAAGSNPTTIIPTTTDGSNPTTIIPTTTDGSNPTTTLILTTAAGSNPTTTFTTTTTAGNKPTTTLTPPTTIASETTVNTAASTEPSTTGVSGSTTVCMTVSPTQTSTGSDISATTAPVTDVTSDTLTTLELERVGVFLEGVSEAIIRKADPTITDWILQEINATNIRENLKEWVKTPHIAGTPRDLEQAEELKQFWTESGLDEAYTSPYDILLSYPSDTEPNKVKLFNGTDVVLESPDNEENLTPAEWSDDFPFPYLGYSGNGTVTVRV